MAAEQFIQRGRHQSGFAVLSNKIWEDPKLSIEAKGTLGYLLSRPANWRVRLRHVAQKLGMGMERLYRIINECIAAGYIERRQGRKSGVFLPVSYYVRDVAFLPHTGLPDAAEPDAVEPRAAKPEALIRKNSNKKYSEQVISSPSPSPSPRTLAREGGEIAMEVLATLPVSARAQPGWRGLSAWIEDQLGKGTERVDIVVGISQCLHSLKDQPPSTFGYFRAAIARARDARTAPLPGVPPLSKPPCEHGLGSAGEILRKGLGEPVFAAWFAHASIIDASGDTVTLGVPTRFVRSRILAEFETACVDAFSRSNPAIKRIVVVAEDAR